MWKGVTVVTRPTLQPITMPQLKLQLGLDDEAWEPFLSRCRDGAVGLIDGPSGIGCALLTQTWRKSYDCFPDQFLLPGWPVKSVTSIKYIDVDGAEQTIDPADYRVDINSEPVRVAPAFGQSWPAARAIIGAVWVDYVLGETKAEDIEAPLIDAIGMICAHRVRNKDAVIVGSTNTILKLGVDDIFAQYRRNTVAA